MRATTQAGALARTAAAAEAARVARAREAEALLASLVARKARIGQEFFDMGRELARLADGEYHAALGYATFAAMIEGRSVCSRAVAWRLIAVYRSVPRATANRLGPNKSIEWLRLLRTEAGEDATEEEVQAAARGPAVVEGRPVTELTTRELVELRRRTAERLAAGRRDPGAADAHKLARALAQQLRACGADDASVTARYARAWRLRVELGVPAGLALSRALAGTRR